MLSAVQQDRPSAGRAALLPGAVRVGLTRLVLTHFRNYSSARRDLNPDPVVLTGPNGAGKTNLLEAISLLAPGRGLRNARLADIEYRAGSTPFPSEAKAPLISLSPNGDEGRDEGDSHDRPAAGWTVAATIETRRGPVRIGTGRDRDGGERRAVRIEGEPARGQAALAERIGVLWLTPAMDRLFVEGPAGRRRLMDRLVLGLDPAHATRLARYEHAIRERSRLLRDGSRDQAWLAALEDIMAAEGIAVAAARREAIDQLDRVCAAAEGAFPRARLSLLGEVEDWLAAMPALAAEERLRDVLAHNRASDAVSGGAGCGPHRSDLAVVHAGKGIPAEIASTGEQKALLIAIILAQAKLQQTVRGEPPLLLLDEVAAHLDAARRAALFDILAGHPGQAWITGTDAALFAPLRGAACFLTVNDGALSETV